MHRRHPSLLAPLAALSLCAATVVACFPLERGSALLPGTVRGQARFSGEGRDNVGVQLSNTRFGQRSDDGGDFLIAGLGSGTHGLRLQEDDDNDGIADRGAAVGFSITTGEKDVVGVDLGPIAMRGTVTVSGTISDEDGDGLDGLVVVVTRFELDRTAEVLLPVSDDDGDGVVEYSLRGVVPGRIEVQAFAAGGRASPAHAIDLGDDSDEEGIDLAVADVDVVPVSTNVSPLLDTARFALVAVDAGPNAPAIAGDRVGRVIDVEAGVYDVWFFAGDASDTTPIAVLPRQVARPFETPAVDDEPRALQWGPALRGAISGIDGTENTLPVVSAPSERRVLASMAGGSTSIPLEIADPDGDTFTVEVVPPPAGVPLSFALIGTELDVTALEVTYTGAVGDPGAALFSRTPIQIAIDDGRGVVVQELGVAVIADGVFIGPGPDFNDLDNWLGGIRPGTQTDNVVVESPVSSASGLVFAALDLRSSLEIVDSLAVTRVFSSNGDGLVQGGGVVTLAGTEAAPGLFVGRAHDVSIHIEGVVELRDVRVIQSEGVDEGTYVVEVKDDAVLQQGADSGEVYIEIPVSTASASLVRLTGGAVVHFTKNLDASGQIESDDLSGFAFGYDTDVTTLTVTTEDVLQLGTLSFAGAAGSVFSVNAPVRATRELRIVGDARVDLQREQAEAVSLVMTTPGSTLTTGSVLVVGGGTGTGSINGTVEGAVSITGDVAIAGRLVVLGVDLDGLPFGQITVDPGAILRFGPDALLRTENVFIEGTLDLAGAGRMEIVGADDAVNFGARAALSSRDPFAHELAFDPGVTVDADEDLVLFNNNADAALAFDTVDVPRNRFFVRSGDVTVRELILGEAATADIDPDGDPPARLTVASCTGPGTAAVCPAP